MVQRRKLVVLLEAVKKLIRRKDYKHVANIMRKIHSADIAYILRNLRDTDRVLLIQMLYETDLELAAEAVSELGQSAGVELLESLTARQKTEILRSLESDDAVELISGLSEDSTEVVLDMMDSEESSSVRDLLLFEPDTAGRIMNTDFLTFHETMTVREAIQRIQERRDSEVLFYIYVVDADNHLSGVLSLKNFMLSPPSKQLKSLMRTNVITVSADADQEEVAREVAKYNLLAIPVVDDHKKIVGVITVDDIIDVIKKELTEDLLYLAGVDKDDHTYTTPMSSIRKRIPWLSIYLGIGLVTAWVVSMFEGTIGKYVILSFFLPLVGGMAGNSGNQTMTVTVRGIALGELQSEYISRYFWKEFRVGLFNGAVMGLFAGIVSGTLGYIWGDNIYIGLVMMLAIFINISLSSVWGTLTPIFLNWFKIDPALASGIFVSTLNDLVGFATFLGLAAMLFRYFGI